MAWIRDRALTLALMAMFLVFLVGQGFTGLLEYNAEQAQHGRATVAMADYLSTGHPWEALFENWESAVYLRQRWSPESKPVHAPHTETGR